MKIQIRIDDQLSPQLREVYGKLQNRAPMMQKLGGILAKGIRKHFRQRNSQPNANGWPKRNFWNKEGRENTALTHYDQTSATVTIASPAIVHKLKGGTVRPKRGRALAIPACAEAYRAIQPSAMNKDMLEFVPIPKSGGLIGLLAERQHDTRRRRRGGKVWFWLVAQATHRPDPNTLPPDREMDNLVQNETAAYLQKIADSAK